jgi:hypothetical protein
MQVAMRLFERPALMRLELGGAQMIHSQTLRKLANALGRLLLVLGIALGASAQTANSGKLTGTVTDPNGAVIPGASVVVQNQTTGEQRTLVAGDDGSYNVPLLPPGSYKVTVSKSGFKTVVNTGVAINVTETTTLPIQLGVGATSETVTVSTGAVELQTENSALGDVIDSHSIGSLPMVTRNFGEILNLSAGVSTSLVNASSVGRGDSSGEGGVGSSSAGAKDVNGGHAYDNNFMVNGMQVNDQFAVGVFGGINQTGGFAVPNPDTIQEFKVQTGLYDASYGRNAGAQINIITKSGSNQFHSTLWEYFRNNVLNGNDWFAKLTGSPRGVLRQNQFGLTVGGPVYKDKVLMFGSYQGTRQANGIASQCSGVITNAPGTLTNDRSATGLGSAFAGQRGVNDTGSGLAIAADGSNINPSALELFQAKLPSGQYLIPTPQKVIGGLGFSQFSQACSFNEDQLLANLDYHASQKDTISARFIWINSDQTNTFNAANVPGVGDQTIGQRFRVGSAHWTRIISSNVVNQLNGGIYTIANGLPLVRTVTYPSLGISTPAGGLGLISITVGGVSVVGTSSGSAYSIISANPASTDQLGWEINDNLSWTRGPHGFRFGGDLIRQQLDDTNLFTPESLNFQSVPDLLLGRPAGAISSGGNGTTTSNVYASSSNFEQTPSGQNLSPRYLRSWDMSGFAQDDWKLSQKLTLNLGVRYEFMGDIMDATGKLAFADSALFNPNPTGLTYQGFIVAHNYASVLKPLPTGITVSPNNSALANHNQNTWNPRVGFAFEETSKLVLHGGYGIYDINPPMVSVFAATQQGAPWAGTTLGGSEYSQNTATLQDPFPQWTANPSIAILPNFASYGCTASCGTGWNSDATYTNYTNYFLNQTWRPAYTQTYTLNQQVQLPARQIVTIAYVGTRSLHVAEPYHFNQPLRASATNSVRGATTNTLNNILQRTPYLGVSQAAPQMENFGTNFYNGLQVSLRKDTSHGLHYLLSYTWSKDLDTAGPWASLSPYYGGGSSPGNAYAPHRLYGLSSWDRPRVFVASYTYDLPKISADFPFANLLVNGWELAGETAIQTGTSLTVYGANVFNAFAQILGPPELSGTCGSHSVQAAGSIQRRIKSNGYFNGACYTDNYPVLDTGTGATDFGNGGIGTSRGPDQNSTNISFIKHTRVPFKEASVEFRAELFNAFNHPQFANPSGEPPVNVVGPFQSTVTNFGSISSTSVNPRVIQFALRLSY